ncbi:hypothetical protein [Candidatus Albibeggiatoa sp. nov. NOAA]|uniref:hypothetical protein n=1 Tax=Candidatus Albibeggiatoa sp. nov. NOAA TaxID=3162724 RepID=UPI0032F39607|nr:hypothetical protein [Thiotrichaceae bacterium]
MNIVNKQENISNIFFVLAVIIAAIASLFLFKQGLMPCDDAYITFRHAKNFAMDLWPAWNLTGEPVLGSTTPGFVLILGSIGLIFGSHNIEIIALFVNIIVLFFLVIISYLITLDICKSYVASILTAILVGFNSVNIYTLSLGFESGLFASVVLSCFYLARKKYYALGAIVASIAPLIRPEGILVVAIFFLFTYFERAKLLKLILLFCIIPFIYTIYSLNFYGSVVPQSIEAKKHFSTIYKPYDETGNFDFISRVSVITTEVQTLWVDKIQPTLLTGFTIDRSEEAQKVSAIIEGLILLFLMLAVPLYLLFKKDRRIIYFLYPIGFILLYAFIGHVQFWYLPSFITSILIVSISGAVILIDKLNLKTIQHYAHFLIIFLLFFILIDNNQYRLSEEKHFIYAEDPRGSIYRYWELERFISYRNAAEALNNISNEKIDTSLINEVGFFGYFYKGNVFDSVGLCSPEAVAFYPPPKEDIFNSDGTYKSGSNQIIPSTMVYEVKPDYLVTSRVNILHLLEPSSVFLQDYEYLGKSGTAWGGDPVDIFKKR